MAFIFTYIVIMCTIIAGTVGDSRCEAIGGNCQYDLSQSACPGGVKRGLCSGPSARRCCLPGTSNGDSRCEAIGGNCQYDLSQSACPGGVKKGLCSGPSTRRCCLPGTSKGSSCFTSSEMKALEEKLIQYESIKLKAYDAQPKNSYVDWTICVGFNLRRRGAQLAFESVLPGVNFDSVNSGGASLSRDQCMRLFRHDLSQTYIPRAEEVAGSKFCSFPLNVKIAIVNAVYRGDLKKTHKTAGYIRAGNWCAVPAEYLDYDQYKNCKKLGIPGVCKRMKWNADQFQSMCKRQKN